MGFAAAHADPRVSDSNVLGTAARLRLGGVEARRRRLGAAERSGGCSAAPRPFSCPGAFAHGTARPGTDRAYGGPRPSGDVLRPAPYAEGRAVRWPFMT